MPSWTPARRFQDPTDVYIIGGGPSLKGFDWELLRDRPTIGCNAAFKLGPGICEVCFFSDKKWFLEFRHELDDYSQQGGQVFTHCAALYQIHVPYLYLCRRENHGGLHQRHVFFGNNSGCSAVALALIMGATRVFLLGFDCRVPEGNAATHWHDWQVREPHPSAYGTHMRGWGLIAATRPKVFPDRQIINLGPDSAIPYFPKADCQEHFAHARDHPTTVQLHR